MAISILMAALKAHRSRTVFPITETTAWVIALKSTA
jgi:hypothetical protein